MANPDGGSAFPDRDQDAPGLTIRDVFAAAALAGITSTLTAGDVLLIGGPDATCGVSAVFAYKIADAMLKARGNVATQETPQ